MGLADEGTLESSILDTDEVDEWDVFTGSGSIPSGTSMSFQFRSSPDYINMGTWSDIMLSFDTTLTEILDDSTRYLQYRVIMETSDPVFTPELQELSFTYYELGIGESGSDEDFSWFLSVAENPSHSFFSALVTVPEAGTEDLSLYDVSGRVIAFDSQELNAGTHSVTFAGLAQGVYFCTLRAGDFTATERVVVLK